jgi:hypothetical protein
MAKLDRVAVCVALTGTLLSSVAYGDDAAKCEAAKLKIAGKYEFCRAKAWAKEAKAGNTGTPDFTKCDPAFSAKWSAAETKGNGQCPTIGDEGSIQLRIAGDTLDLAVLMSGAIVPVCGNGVIEGGEVCEFNNLNGQTCQSQGFVGGQLSCKVGTCVFDTSGCFATRFVDNGDGTVTDHKTGLQWEQKDNLDMMANFADPHDADNGYTWSAHSPAADGSVYTDFLATLNNGVSEFGTGPVTGCFAGHCDWRLPSMLELQDIVDGTQGNCGGGSGACIDPAFGPTWVDIDFGYGSATTLSYAPALTWTVNFLSGETDVSFFSKPNYFHFRAVRGGS